MLLDNFSIGIDLIEIERFRNITKKTKFIENTFTKRELKYCKKKRTESLAGRFAAKEAVRKTIDENVKFNRIEIINKKDGSPQVNFLDKKIKEKYKAIISIAHTKQLAQAVCLTMLKQKKS